MRFATNIMKEGRAEEGYPGWHYNIPLQLHKPNDHHYPIIQSKQTKPKTNKTFEIWLLIEKRQLLYPKLKEILKEKQNPKMIP